MKLALRILAASVAAGLAGSVMADSFSGNGAGGAIPDGSGTNVPGAPLLSTVVVPGTVGGPIGLVWIQFDRLAHTWVGDLTIRLLHPDNTALDIQLRPGRGSASTFGFSSDFVNTNSYAFADSGVDLYNVTPPATIPGGTYKPSSNPNPPATNALPWVYNATSFAAAFNGKLAPGTWTLELIDWAGGDTGSIGGWTLHIETIPAPGALALLGAAGLVARRRRRA